ncbi:MAG: TadE family protein [Moraxellaceae bacterium]|jgi:Flp pilus assembly protein TadG|nr:TadE family protein [Moraxellaceae bacterium]
MRRNPVSASGTAVIEFAFVLPVLLIVFFGIIEFSVALFNKAILTNASREAARSGIVYVGPNTTLTDEAIIGIATNNCQGLITFQDDVAPVVTVTRADSPDFEQQLLTVRINYSYSGLGLGQLLTSMSGPLDLDASTTMKFE